METGNPLENHHTSGEFTNLWVSQSLIREWGGHPKWQAYDVLPALYKALHTGKKYIPGLKGSPKLADVVRNTNAHITGSPDNLLPEAPYVYLLTSKYTTELDGILTKTPKTTEQGILDGAFAYYIFDRIHPFPDGNGRIGRMIAKRVFKGAGLKDPIFHDQTWYGHTRSDHLESLEEVDRTNNLAHLELFLAESLLHMYDPKTEAVKRGEVADVIEKKSQEIKDNGQTIYLSDIWEGFREVPVFGNGF